MRLALKLWLVTKTTMLAVPWCVCVCVNVCVWNMVGVRLSRADLIQGFVYVSPSSSGLPGDCLPKVVA